MGPQQALETAVRNAIRSTLGYTNAQCDRTFNGQPHPRCGPVFVSVWSDNRRESQQKTCMDEVHSVFVTVTLRCVKPFDRWVDHRDDLETRMNAIRALVGRDIWDYPVTRAANALGPFDGASEPIGFREALWFQGLDAIEEKGADWFAGDPDSTEYGLAQRARFGGARRIQALATMS